MATLYHQWLSGPSRLVRISLGEQKREVRLVIEKTWDRRREFLKMNPAGEVPVLVEDDGNTYCDARVILEYLEETAPEPLFLGETAAERAETRRIVGWFADKFEHEVARILVREKVMKRFLKMGTPSSSAIRAAHKNLSTHLAYVNWLTERRHYLAGETISAADFAAAAWISVADYLDDIEWSRYETVKEWYMRVKSRPSMRGVLSDRIAGLFPPTHYDKLDF